MQDMLSPKAVEWLNSIDYESKSHEERMKLIEAARVAYPNTEDTMSKELFMQILGLA